MKIKYYYKYLIYLLRSYYLYLVLLILIIFDINYFKTMIKNNLKIKDNPYKVENMIKTFSIFKSYINCKESIYIFIKEPQGIVHSNFVSNYSLSPCVIKFEGESKFEAKKGYHIINKIHPDYENINQNIIYSTSEFKLIKI